MDKIDKLIEEGLGQLIKANPALAGLGGAGLGAGAGALYNYTTDGAENYATDASNDLIDQTIDTSRPDGRGVGKVVQAMQREGQVVDANNLTKRITDEISNAMEKNPTGLKKWGEVSPEAYQKMIDFHQQGLDTLGPENAQINSLIQTAAPGAALGAGTAVTAAMLANRKK